MRWCNKCVSEAPRHKCTVIYTMTLQRYVCVKYVWSAKINVYNIFKYIFTVASTRPLLIIFIFYFTFMFRFFFVVSLIITVIRLFIITINRNVLFAVLTFIFTFFAYVTAIFCCCTWLCFNALNFTFSVRIEVIRIVTIIIFYFIFFIGWFISNWFYALSRWSS